MDGFDDAKAGKCPVMHGARPNAPAVGRTNRDWWPNHLELRTSAANSLPSNPMPGLQLCTGVPQTDFRP